MGLVCATLTLGLAVGLPACGSSSPGVEDAGSDGGDGGFICAGDEDCDGDEKCVDGVCRPPLWCETNEDCEKGFLCNKVVSTCIEAECIEDTDCGPRQYCDEGTCKGLCDEVTCPLGQRCDPNTGVCEIMSCTVGSAECQDDEDCPPTLFCDPVLHGCTECPTGFTCNQYFCTALQVECRAHSECEVGERCNPKTNQCEPFPDSCISDMDCDPKYCNLYTHTCQDEPFTGSCESDEECKQAYGEDYYCHPRLRTCVLPIGPGECYDTEDCGDPELVCNPKDNTCVERGTICTSDEDCNPGDVCINGTCVFQCESTCTIDEDCGYDEICRNGCCVEDQSCSYDWECGAGEDCVNGWCTPTGPCVDDGYEDNDDPTTATQLQVSPNSSEDYLGLAVCSNDDDWYAIRAPAGSSIRVHIHFDDDMGDVDMKLYNDGGTSSIDSSTGVSDDEEVYWRDTPVDTTYHVRVYGWSGCSNTYDMTVTLADIVDPCATDDVFEENDSSGSAAPLTFPALNTAEDFVGLTACSGDDDWFVFDAPAGARIEASILFEDSYGDLNMALYADPQASPLDTGTSTTDNESVTYTTAAEGTFYLRIYAVGSGGNSYQLRLEHKEPLCSQEDAFEPNNDEDSAWRMDMPDPGPDGYPDLLLCMDDQDWFAFPLDAGDGLEIEVLFLHSAGDIEAYLYDPDGEYVDSSISSSDNEEVEERNAEMSGLYKLKVYHSSGSYSRVQDYALRVSYYPDGVDPSCEDDLLEPNDEPAAASPLGATMSNAVLCGGDRDWYSLPVLAGERVTITCLYDDANGKDLNMDLVDADGQTVLAGTGGVSTLLNRAELSYRSDAAATLYLELYMVNPAPDYRDVYDLFVDRAIIDCGDGGYEPNESWDAATTLGEGNYSGMYLCTGEPDDEDWYMVNVAEGERLHVGVDANPAIGDLELEVYASDGTTLLVSSTTDRAHEEVQTERAFSDTPFYVRIYPYSLEGDLPYRMSVWIDPPIVCADDALEHNDLPADATPVSDGFSDSSLVLCHADPDWFAVNLPARWRIEATATYDSMVGPLDLSLTNADGTAVVDSSATHTGSELVEYVAMADAELRIKVAIPDPEEDDRLPYALSVDLIEPQPCTDDGLEPNNDRLSASPLDETGYTGLMLCPGDADYFTYDIQRGQSGQLTLTNTGGVGDADLFLYRFDGEQLVEIASSENADQNDDIISGEAYLDETLYAAVMPKSMVAQDQIVYALSLAISSFPICDDDYLEPNDERVEATDLNSATWAPQAGDWTVTYAGLHICKDNASNPFPYDYFGIDLDEGDTVFFSVPFDSGDVDIHLYRNDETSTVASSAGGSNPEEIEYEATETARYYLRVKLYSYSSADETDYDLTVLTSHAFICLDPPGEPYEPNDDFAEADANGALAAGSHPYLTICGIDYDYYLLDAAAGQDVTVTLSCSGGDADLDLFLYDGNRALLDSGESFGCNEQVSAGGLATDGAYALVRHYRDFAGVMAAYDLDVLITGP
ncbi:MAG: hypothetical protein JXR96_20700 [Deltaproteobacteria bacterium]|nr:hypothetical protein [Deltaproteobacteria bacterium]